MKAKLYEAKWQHHISGETASSFHTAIEEANIEEVKANSIALLSKCKEFFDPEEQDYILYEIEDLIDSFTEVMDDEEEVDILLDELYDFCDGYNIFIDLDTFEPESSEVSVDEVEIEPEEEHSEEEIPSEEETVVLEK